MIIDASNLILGRMASVAAKKALLGETVDIINCEKAVIVGNKKDIISKYVHRLDLGQPQQGPFIKRNPEGLVRRTVRGMIPYKKENGKKAYKKVKCHIGVPESFKNSEKIALDKANVLNTRNMKYITVAEICRLIGGKKWL